MTNETIIELQNLVQELQKDIKDLEKQLQKDIKGLEKQLQKDIKDLEKQIDKIPNFNYEKRNGTIVLNNVRIE